jgi:hypothetical protein
MLNWINLPDETNNCHGFVYIINNNYPNSEKKYYIV